MSEHLEKLLELKSLFWGIDSEEYREWKEYFLGLSKDELEFEYIEHFIE